MPQIGAYGTLLMLSPLLLVTVVTGIHGCAHPVMHTEPTIDVRSTCWPRCPHRLLRRGTAAQREPSGSGAVVSMCEAAL